MTLGTLTTLTRVLSGDADGTRYTGRYTEALNFAQQQFALDSKALFVDQSITVTGGTAAYSLNTDFMWEKKVTYNGQKLDPISRAELEEVQRGDDWTDDTGTPTHYIIDPEQARRQIRFYPYPPSGDASRTAVLTYYPLPTDLAASGDTPLNSSTLLTQFHMGLAAWAAWFLLANEPQTLEIGAKRKELISIYNDTVSQAADTFKNTAAAIVRRRTNRR